MGTIKYIAGAVLSIAFITFVAFFGKLPQLRKTPIGWLYRLICCQFPAGLRAADQKFTHGRISSCILRQARYLWNDRHPLVLVLFVLLLGVSEVMFLPPAWPLFSISRKISVPIIVVLPWIFLYASAMTDPGYVNLSNHDHQMSLYPYDFAIFYPGQVCRTCHLLKPARSKHCSICKRCVSKLDHHCIFINNCVGYRNHHFFILLVSTTAFLQVYATYVGISLLTEVIQKQIPNWTIYGREYTWAQYGHILAWALDQNTRIGAVTMLCLLTSPVVLGLLCYHIYLIWAGTTTNETLKWSDLNADMLDGYAFKRTLLFNRPKNERYEPLWTRWPKESGHIISRSFDGQVPNPVIIGHGEWQQVWELTDVQNIYDLGFIDNLRDVFCPEYTFKQKNSHSIKPII